MRTAQQSTLNKHIHFHLGVFQTLCDKVLSFLGVTSWMNVWWYVYINVWNRHLIPIPTPIPITTIPTPIPIPITTIPTPIPTPPKWTLPVSFGGDTKSRRSLLSGVYARGSKRPHQSALECVTVVDSTAHSKTPPEVRLCGGKRCPALKKEEEEEEEMIPTPIPTPQSESESSFDSDSAVEIAPGLIESFHTNVME